MIKLAETENFDELEAFVKGDLECEIDGKPLTLKPLGGRAVKYISKMSDENTSADALFEMVEETLKVSYPNSKSIEKLSIGFRTKLVPFVFKVNDIEYDETDMKTTQSAIDKAQDKLKSASQ